MSLSRYAAAELASFLTAIDAALHQAATLVVIGGSALALGYGGTAATNDIDTYESDLEAIEAAAERARAETGLNIPIANSTIAQLPDGYEERLKQVPLPTKKLTIFVLDAYDLAASKLLRGNQHDRQQLTQLHELVSLDRAVLVSRFRELMTGFVGDPTEPWWSLRHFVQETWGELLAAEIDELIPRGVHRGHPTTQGEARRTRKRSR